MKMYGGGRRIYGGAGRNSHESIENSAPNPSHLMI